MISMKKEVLLSLFFKIGGMGFGFVAVSILIKNLGAEYYGVWATLVSLLAWIQLSDFGIGYALKNRIASANVEKDMLPLVLGVFQFYVVVSLSLALFFIAFGRYFDFVQQYQSESYVLYLGMLLLFPFTVGAAILQGLQRNSISNFMIFVQGLLWLFCVFLWSEGVSLLKLSIMYISVSIFAVLAQCTWGVRMLTGHVWQALREVKNYKHAKLAIPLWNVGLRFLILQLTSVVLFSLGTYLTYSNVSAEAAATYDILFKFYQVFLTIFNIILSVYWPSITQAISENKKDALQKKFYELHTIAFAISFLSLLFSWYFAPFVIDRYSHGELVVSRLETMMFAMLITIQMFAYSGAVFLNAVEKLKGQIILAVLAAGCLIPFALFLYQYGLGLISVPIAVSLLLLPSLIYCNWSAYFEIIQTNR